MSYVKMNLCLEFQYPQVMQIGTFELVLKNPNLWDQNIWSELFSQIRHGISNKEGFSGEETVSLSLDAPK